VKSSKTDNENARGLLQRDLLSYTVEVHTAAEALIKPCAVEMETCVFGEESKKNLKQFSYIVTRRTQDSSADTEKQLVSRLKSPFAFSLELNQSMTY
jgi:hypothetical protein